MQGTHIRAKHACRGTGKGIQTEGSYFHFFHATCQLTHRLGCCRLLFYTYASSGIGSCLISLTSSFGQFCNEAKTGSVRFS